MLRRRFKIMKILSSYESRFQTILDIILALTRLKDIEYEFLMASNSTISAREGRLLNLQKIGRNIENWWGDGVATYVDKPIETGNIPKLIAGTGALIVSAFTDVPDAVIGGAIGKEIPAPGPVPFSRLRRDAAVELPRDLLHFRFLATASDVFRLPGDVLMDTFDVTIGANHTGS